MWQTTNKKYIRMKILVLDIETSPILSYHWRMFDENIGLEQIVREWSVLSYCAKWLGEKEVFYEDTSKQRDLQDDRRILRSLHSLLDRADFIIAQNGKKFDLKKINARMIMNGMEPYSPVKVIDTLSIARKHFGFTSNKLEWMGKNVGGLPKHQHRKFPGFLLWKACMNRTAAAWKEMRDYNIQDVLSAEKLYMRFRPWIENHPNLAVLKPTVNGEFVECPKCESKKVQRRGIATTQTYVYDRFHCQNCGGWHRGRKRKKD